MVPTNLIIADVPALLAADTSTLAPASNPPSVTLVAGPFTPSPATIPGDLVAPTFDGYAAIACAVGAQLTGQDPFTLSYFTEMKIPTGGWRWAVTGTTNLPQTIYGVALVNHGSTVVYGSAVFPTPIVLNAVGQVIEVPNLRFTFNSNAIS